MMRRCVTLMALMVLALATVAQAAPQDGRAQELFRRGKAYYEQAQYEEAIGAFLAARRLRPSPILDYNIGRCHEQLGNRKRAIAAFQRYLRGMPYAENGDKVRRRIEALKSARDSTHSEEAEPAAAPGSQPAAAASQPAGAASQPVVGAGPTALPATGVTASGPAEAATSSSGQAGAAVPQHEAMGGLGLTETKPRQRTPGKRSAAPMARRDTRRAPVHPAPGAPDKGPIYKKWWFWVGCAGAAVIVGFIVATAVSKPDPTPQASSSSLGGLTVSF